jgi:hypothetical protein
MRKAMRKTLTALILALGAASPSYATDFFGTSIPIPAGLVQGDKFQLVFVTAENYTASSANISDYNADVTTSANQPTSLVNGLGITWSCLCSTGAVNVQSNIANTSPGTPNFSGIFDLGGNQIADGTETSGEGLYSGTIEFHMNTYEDGTTGGAFPWTGTDASGNSTSFTLGQSVVTVGNDGDTNGSWTAFSTNNPPLGNTDSLYAISGPLELGPNNTLEVLPEPATIWSTVVGLAVGMLAMRRKRNVPRTTSATPAPR